MTNEQIAEWEAYAAECERAAGRAEGEAARAKNTMEYNRWISHANNFAATAKRVRSLLPNPMMSQPMTNAKRSHGSSENCDT